MSLMQKINVVANVIVVSIYRLFNQSHPYPFLKYFGILWSGSFVGYELYFVLQEKLYHVPFLLFQLIMFAAFVRTKIVPKK